MIPIPTDVEGLAVRRDPRSGAWLLEGWGRVHRLREWTWAERRCLVDACTRPDGFDTTAFLRGMLALLVDPEPPGDLALLYGYVCLGLLDVRPDTPRQPLSASELALARAFGWGPRELAGQPAAQVDRLLAHLYAQEPGHEAPALGPGPAGARRSPAAPGRHSIVIADAPDPSGGGHG